MTINKRKAMVLEMMKDLKESGLFEAILEREANKAKEQFFKGLTLKDEQAFRVIFMAILQKHDDLVDNEDKEISKNWSKHFIEYHDEKIEAMRNDLQSTMHTVINELGNDFIKEFFTVEERSLEQLIETTGNHYSQAIEHKEEMEKELHKKLHNQLNEVVETLKAITSDKKGNKEFEIHLGEALFNVKLNDDTPCVCDGLSLEEILSMMMEEN